MTSPAAAAAELAETPQMAALIGLLEEHVGDGLIGLSITGSATLGGLRPESDIDLVMVTAESLKAVQRQSVTEAIMEVSGRRARIPGRSVELLSLVHSDVRPWRYPGRHDYLYGEWLRDDVERGQLPQPRIDPNLPVVVLLARDHAFAVRGTPMRALLDPVPRDDLNAGMRAGVPSLLDNLRGDERNVLLTLARIVHTLEHGTIVPKDRAARSLVDSLPEQAARLLGEAADGYTGIAPDHWPDQRDAARRVAQLLARRIDQMH